jgi:hypothetical protein
MRKKLLIFAALTVVAAFAAIAYAQEPNTYTVTGGTSPTNAGSKAKPVPVSVKFNYTVGTASGNRPSPLKRYSIAFKGLTVNTNSFPKCSTSTLETGTPDDKCPAKSIMGTGYIENATGAKDNPADQSVKCNAKLWVVNGGANKANIYVKGSPSATDPREQCAIELAAPIPAKFVKKNGGTALEFDVPPSLLHPLPTLDNAVKRVQSTIKKVTAKKNGKTVGFFQSEGGCVGGKRDISVTFTPESGAASTTTAKVSCKK